jgi:hypothetical protein
MGAGQYRKMNEGETLVDIQNLSKLLQAFLVPLSYHYQIHFK